MKKLRVAVGDKHRMHMHLAATYFVFILILKIASSKDNILPHQLKLSSTLTCRLIGGLTREQRSVCHSSPETATIAFEGLQMAVKECQHQFRWHRWNCSSLLAKSTNPHNSAIMKRGFREAAFLYALTAAGVAHSVARACAQGRLISCGCDPLGYRTAHERGRARANKWEWSGCSHNLGFGIEFSKKFLDVREQVDDLQSKINVHNNNAGRSILSSHMEVRCKCHGLSGSCQLRTCWRTTPDFRIVASTIKREYRKALVVAQEELNNGPSVLRGRPRGRRRSRARPAPKTSLLFFEKSPSFCEVDPKMDSAGTAGRVCRIGRQSRSGSCDLLCCGRGHDLIRKSSIKPCNCTFHWCCRVDCQKCQDEKWIAIYTNDINTFNPLIKMRDGLNISSLPSPQDRYTLEKKLGSGVFGEVHRAKDNQAAGKAIAIKIQVNTEENETHIQDEYRILRDFTKHPNLIDFYGVFCDKSEYTKKIWFVIELCEYGSVIDIVRKLKAMDKKMSEEHIAYILKYTIKAAVYLHDNKIIHRNIKCSNILITKDGEVKLTDFGLSCQLGANQETTRTSIGSPAWMAPEAVACSEEGYGNRVDVWSLGICTIEMVDGIAPYEKMHPTRAMFQIQRTPPPSVAKPSMSSNDINDFITECLEKNPEHRPFMMELEEHPYIQSVPENDFHLSTELKMLALDLNEKEVPFKINERIIKNGLLLSEGKPEPETMQVEDLAALDYLTEDNILCELQVKYQKGSFTSFIGDVLLILNPNSHTDIYTDEYHQKYECKSRSENAPHIFAVADSAYQDTLHHNEPQYIIFSGESKSGKSTSMVHALSHLTYLGSMKNNTAERIQKATTVIQACISGATPMNSSSTRGILQVQVTYGTSGKLSGALFWLYQLEKWRVSSTDMTHANFDIIYYFYDAMEAQNRLGEFYLEGNRKHRYLRILDDPPRGFKGVRESPKENASHYKELVEHLKILDWEEEDIKFFETVLAAILVLGNVRFRDGKNGSAEIENPDEAKKVAKLLSLEEVKFLWALLNYCLIENGTAVKRKHATDEARDARDTLASALYKRLVDWLINVINAKLSFMRSVFGDKYSVSLLDMFGFECYHRNRLEQLIVNTTNEQIQFLYNQRIFAWEMQEAAEDEIPVTALRFYDNKNSVDQLMAKPLGIFYILDDASRTSGGQEYIMSTIKSKCKGPYVKLSGSHEFGIAHYTGKVNYDAREMADKNKDFLPPEMIETMRASTNLTLQQLFRNKFTKAGNLTAASNQSPSLASKSKSEKESENIKARKYNTVSKGQYSQIRRMRTAAATYRSTSLELLKLLSIGPGSGGTHYVRCVRTDLNDSPRGFQPELIRQQLRALSVLDTAKARQHGFSYRVPFAEFIRRYRFLAFDFEETVDETADNCRLLLIRLKMENWELGKTKVFLKYYNEEFLSRLYETQVKKIVKVQSMMRCFLAKRKAVKNKSKVLHIKELKKQKSQNVSDEEAALVIQKAYRGYVVRKAYGPLVSKTSEQIDDETSAFLKRFAMKWKSRSIFQVLLQYRALRYQDLVHFSQQVHMYNQAVVEGLLNNSTAVVLDRVDPHAKEKSFLGSGPPTVWKLPFRMDQIQFYDTSHMCDPSVKSTDTFASPYDSDSEQWDEPFKRRCSSVQTDPFKASTSTQTLITMPFCRDPTQPVPILPPDEPDVYSKGVSYSKPVIYKKPPTITTPMSFYQPPAPWQSGVDDTDILENTAGRRPSYTRSNITVDKTDLPNPISELQAMAKSARQSREEEDDEPPFNFQAMLKKTPKNRASMKRHGEAHQGSYDHSPNSRYVTTSYGAQVPRKTFSPSEASSVIMSPTHSIASSRGPPRHEFDRGHSQDFEENNFRKSGSRQKLGFRDNKDETETIEIAPGITIEGAVADL